MNLLTLLINGKTIEFLGSSKYCFQVNLRKAAVHCSGHGVLGFLVGLGAF